MCKPIPVAFLLLITAVPLVRADLVFVANPSFEDISGESPYNEFTFGPLNGWDLYDPGSIANGGAGSTFYIGTIQPTPPVYFTQGAPHGQRVGIAFNFANGGGQGSYGFQQTLSATLQPNTHYTLSVDVGNIASGTSIDNTFFDLRGFPGYQVQLLAGQTVLSQDNNLLNGLIAEGDFATTTVSFTTGNNDALLNQALGIRLINLNQPDPQFVGAHLEVDFDNVRLSAFSAVPEPSSLGFVGFGLLMGAWKVRQRWHRRK